MAEQFLEPAPRPSRRRALMVSTLLASLAGLGLVAHQAGFVVWDMEGVDLGLTQVAHAGSEFGHPSGAAAVSENLDDTTEMLRRAESLDSGNIPAIDPFSVLDRRTPPVPKGKVMIPRAKPRAAQLAGDSDHDQVVQGELETRDRFLDSCGNDEGCADEKAHEIDDEVEDRASELVVASIKDELSDAADVDRGGKEECDDDRGREFDHDWGEHHDGGERGEGGRR